MSRHSSCWSLCFQFTLFLVCSSLIAIPTAEAGWKVGVASVKITPEKPMWMAGYAARKKPSEGVAQDLFAKALAIQDDQGQRLVVVTTDLIGIPRDLRLKLEAAVKEKYQLPREGLWLNASHTHCGPELRMSRVPLEGPADEVERRLKLALDYTAKLEQQLIEIIGLALKNPEPANLDYVHARCGFAMNRRRPTVQGFINSPHSDGPVNHNVPVLRITNPDGKPRVLLFSYSCHNTTMGFEKFCGDYAGYAQEYLQADHEGVMAMFFTGCAADQNPYPRRKFEHVQQHGRALANAVEAALETVPKPINGSLRLKYEEATLDFAPPPSKAELEKLAAGTAEPASGHARRLLKQLAETGTIRTAYPYPVQLIEFGSDWTVVALGGEVVVDYSFRIPRELAGSTTSPDNVWVSGYSNDVFGYVPSLRVLQEGGYEAGGAMLWGSLPGPFATSVEDKIIEKVRELHRKETK